MRTHAVKTSAEDQHERNIIEEYVLENSCLNLRPVEFSRYYPMPKAPQLKTVSIIETLSELARGETDREDSGNVFLPVNNLSLLPEIQRARALQHCLCQEQSGSSKVKNCRSNERIRKQLESIKNNNNVHYKIKNRNSGVKQSHVHNYPPAYILRSQESGTSFGQERCRGFTHPNSRNTCPSTLPNHYNPNKVCSSDFHLRLPYLALRYSTNLSMTSEEKDEMVRHRGFGSRHCFSDSEIDGFEFDGMAINKPRARSKCTSEDSLGTRLVPDSVEHMKIRSRDGRPTSSRNNNLTGTIKECKNKVRMNPRKNKMPEWISSIFRIAKEGKVEKIKVSLKDMDDALVRNLSDCNGNNLWHIACNHNHLSCIQWLCSQFGQVALTDENKHGLTPVVSAVKRGSLLVLQWLLQKKYDQGLGVPSDGKRSLLHFAAKYGQVEILQWLVRYFFDMGYDLNIKDFDGNTALHLAAKYGHIQCVKYITLEGGDLTERNNFGYRPYDMAASNKQSSCSEYLIALEACFSLSTGSYLLESDLQRFQCESMSTRKNFKELQQLMRTSIYHQKELLETFRTVCRESQLLEEEANEQSAESEKGEEQSAIRQGFQNRLKEEFDKWYSNALLKDEATFHLLEEKWRRQIRRSSKHIPENKSPLHIVRSQFAQVFAKASSSNPASEMNVTTSDSSLSEESSDEELSTESLHESSVLPSFMEDIHLNEMLKASSSFSFPTQNFMNKHPTSDPSHVSVKRRGLSNSRLPSKQNRRISLPAENHFGTSLRTLFERNPEFKQEGQTCSVLEVLEPSSSDNEDFSHHESSSPNISKSLNAFEKVSMCATPKSHRVSDLVKLLEDSQLNAGARQAHRKSQGNSYILPHNNSFPCASGTKESLSLEPPLSVTVTKTSECLVRSKEGLQINKFCEMNRTQNDKNLSVEHKNMKSLDEKNAQDANEDRSLSGTDVSVPDSEASESILENSPKKRGFLLKFSLKNRWSSKQKRTTKKPEEKLLIEPKVDAEKLSSLRRSNLHSNGTDFVDERVNLLPVADAALQHKACDRTIPKRRDPPPPVPEVFSKEMENVNLGFSIDSFDVISNVSSAKNVPQSSQDNIQSQQFHSSHEMSRLDESTIKLDSRPPSSASRIDVTPRSEDSFKVVGLPLRKTLSASVELLVTPDCSTAGRQSPAHSEVSKTESALSPPSDVSKTESTRHLNQLGKIEERANVKKPVEIMDITNDEEATSDNSLCYETPSRVEQKTKECRKLDKNAEPSNKPWYEVSDDEDLLGPGRFQRTVRNNSEDEASEMLL